MGSKKYQERIEELFRKSPVVSYSSIERIVKSRKNTEYAKQLVRNLLLKKKIYRLGKGFYTIHNNIQLSVFCFTPSYLGLQDALSMHGLWEQETVPVIITSRKIVPGIRNILGGNVLLRMMEKKYFFGIEYLEDGGIYYPYSDIEKTFIDMIYFRENIDDGTLMNIRSKIDRKKLESYLKRYPSRIRRKVMKVLDKNFQ